jgi:hypothetical protein
MTTNLRRITNDNYKPANSIQENLTQEDIDILLEEYEEINDPLELKTGQHIRYYSLKKTKNGNIKQLFRMGGNIIKIDLENKYIVVSNGKLSWSVQILDSIIYRKMTIEEVKQFYEHELDTKDNEIKKYKLFIDKIKNQNKELQNQNQKLSNDLTHIKQLLKKSGLVK